jgi:hypothetical protein
MKIRELARRPNERQTLLERPVVYGFSKPQKFFELSNIRQDKEQPHPFVRGAVP